MVIRFIMLTEIGVFDKSENMFLVCGHTKNACNRMVMLLKKKFHHKNIYTRQQLNKNLNQNDDVEAKEILSHNFFYLDEMLDKFYKRPAAGSVNWTHIFRMDYKKPGILFLQDSFSSKIRTQDLKKDNLPREERTRLITESLANVKTSQNQELSQSSKWNWQQNGVCLFLRNSGMMFALFLQKKLLKNMLKIKMQRKGGQRKQNLER